MSRVRTSSPAPPPRSSTGASEEPAAERLELGHLDGFELSLGHLVTRDGIGCRHGPQPDGGRWPTAALVLGDRRLALPCLAAVRCDRGGGRQRPARDVFRN